MAKVKKQPRPKAETPKGFRDYFGAEVTQRAEMLSRIAAVYHRYGFDALESSAVETVEACRREWNSWSPRCPRERGLWTSARCCGRRFHKSPPLGQGVTE